MSNLEISSYDFTDARAREDFLKKIPADRNTVKRFHRELLDIFLREMDSRRRGGDAGDESDFIENLYWCGLLLYLVGDPADVSLMWEAKQINMDTACGYDGQFLVGAGVEQTLRHLREAGKGEIANYIQGLKDLGELDKMDEWEKFRIHYFYPDLDV